MFRLEHWERSGEIGPQVLWAGFVSSVPVGTLGLPRLKLGVPAGTYCLMFRLETYGDDANARLVSLI